MPRAYRPSDLLRGLQPRHYLVGHVRAARAAELDATTIKELAVYVHALGGGQ